MTPLMAVEPDFNVIVPATFAVPTKPRSEIRFPDTAATSAVVSPAAQFTAAL